MVFNPTRIIPSNLTVYFRYSGSLTTPPCTEDVNWSVFQSKIKISSRQLRVFRNTSISKNFRPVQNINKRNIYSSVRIDIQSSGKENLKTNIFYFSLFSFILILNF
jgi:carbonic anhydrase